MMKILFGDRRRGSRSFSPDMAQLFWWRVVAFGRISDGVPNSQKYYLSGMCSLLLLPRKGGLLCPFICTLSRYLGSLGG